jgi:hypothetical protein
VRLLSFSSVALLLVSLASACASTPESTADDTSAITVDPAANPASADAITYRGLAGHPGCTIAGLEARSSGCAAVGHPGTGSYAAADIASISGYRCAAKTYPTPVDDPDKPLLLLVHGNSDVPNVFEHVGNESMLAERATDAGFHVLALDLRYDRVDDPKGNNATENAAQNFDHGWAVPIAEHFIDSVMRANPGRPISIVAFSTGATVVRDALRRLHRAHAKPFERLNDVVLVAGGNHGIVNGDRLCRENPTMRGKLGCQLGDRGDVVPFQPTPFLKALNGPDGAFEAPCSDGLTAFGQSGVCGRHVVRYTTLVMKGGDEFLSEPSAALRGATNLTVPTDARDKSLYFCDGLFQDHYGAVRSDAAISQILSALTAP